MTQFCWMLDKHVAYTTYVKLYLATYSICTVHLLYLDKDTNSPT